MYNNFFLLSKDIVFLIYYEYYLHLQSNLLKLIDKNKRIKNLIEKPIENNYISAGVYVFETKLFNLIEKNKYLDMSSYINLLIKKNKKVGACPIHENWLDIGRVDDFKKANNEYNFSF